MWALRVPRRKIKLKWELLRFPKTRARSKKERRPPKAMPMKKKPSSSDNAGACANCERVNPRMSSCARCGLVFYCGRDCQSVHWKEHKPQCIPKADRVPQPVGNSGRPPITRESSSQDEEECAICLDLLAEDGSTLALPCGHVFHGPCVEGLRARGVAKVCPLCRGELPAGPSNSMRKPLVDSLWWKLG